MQKERRTDKGSQDPQLEIAGGQDDPNGDISGQHHRRAAQGRGPKEPRGVRTHQRAQDMRNDKTDKADGPSHRCACANHAKTAFSSASSTPCSFSFTSPPIAWMPTFRL